ncbi:hypothetical protein NC651_021003, partial [Populus alba x Populus x berolinensis]
KKEKKKKIKIATAAVGGGVLLGNKTRFLKTQQFSISKPSPVSVSEIGFLTSQLGGIRISYNPPKPLTAPFTPAIKPLVARRICPITGKKANRATKFPFQTTRPRSCSLSTCSTRGCGGKLASAMSSCDCQPKR